MMPTGNASKSSSVKPRCDCSWRVYAFVIMSNHLHVVLKAPEPNLSRGMQSFLSAYANGWSRRDSRGSDSRGSGLQSQSQSRGSSSPGGQTYNSPGGQT